MDQSWQISRQVFSFMRKLHDQPNIELSAADRCRLTGCRIRSGVTGRPDGNAPLRSMRFASPMFQWAHTPTTSEWSRSPALDAVNSNNPIACIYVAPALLQRALEQWEQGYSHVLCSLGECGEGIGAPPAVGWALQGGDARNMTGWNEHPICVTSFADWHEYTGIGRSALSQKH